MEELRAWFQCKTRWKNRCGGSLVQLASPMHKQPSPTISGELCTYVHVGSAEMHWQVVSESTLLPQLPQGELLQDLTATSAPNTHHPMFLECVYSWEWRRNISTKEASSVSAVGQGVGRTPFVYKCCPGLVWVKFSYCVSTRLESLEKAKRADPHPTRWAE